MSVFSGQKPIKFFQLFHYGYICLFLLSPALLRAANHENSAGIENFSKTSYHAASQNWGVSAGQNGYMYFANHHGLLEFDGTSWQLYELPNKTIMRAVYAPNDSLIYTSGYQEIGYWKRKKTGQLGYHSFKNALPFPLEKNEEFWDIEGIGSKIYFHSFSRLIVYDQVSKQFSRIKVPAFTNTMNKVGLSIYIAVMNKGIYRIKGNQAVPEVISPFFQNKTVRFILPYSKNQLMIGTASAGIVVWDGYQLHQWNPSWTKYLQEKRLNRGYRTADGRLIIGTIIDGVTIFDQHDQFQKHYDVSSGLQNNTILGIATDQFHNIWLAMDSGIAFIEASPVNGIRIQPIKSIGAIYTASLFQGNLYLGTNQGLFRRKINASHQPFQLIPTTQGQVWFTKVYDGHLIAGLNNGSWESDESGGHLISKSSGGFSLAKDPQNPSYLYESTYSSILRLKKTKNGYVQDKTIDGFVDLIRFLEVDHWGNLWASHMHRGIYKLELNAAKDKVVHQTYYGNHSAFGQDHSLHVFKIEGRLVFTSSRILYTYDDLHDSIQPYSILNKQLGTFARAHRIIKAPDHHYWLITSKNIGLFTIKANKATLIRSYPVILFRETPLIDEYENILPLTATKAILCLENGLAWLDASAGSKQTVITSFAPFIRNMELIKQGRDTIAKSPSSNNIKINFPHHNLQLRYSFPHYTSEPIYYEAKLGGLNKQWSEKSLIPLFHFDRLAPGDYCLQVKALDIWGNESRVNSLAFEVLPPWYLSVVARIGYFILLSLGLFIFRYWIVHQTRKKEKAEKESREQEVIRLKNEKLNAEVSHKSKELANTTMAMIKKNEFLMELKQVMTVQKELLGNRFPEKHYQNLLGKIDKNIDNKDDWKIFETNFEQAHEQFLKRLKEDYPMLTNKDLRLCAYLRMNLSSKEIAPLLGISVRGVENHRYRVRGKMNLDHNENLTDAILRY